MGMVSAPELWRGGPQTQIIVLMQKVAVAGYDIVKTESAAQLRWRLRLHAGAGPITFYE